MCLPVAILLVHSGRSSELVLEFGHDSLDFSFGAATSISVSSFQQAHKVVTFAVDPVEFIGTELSPLVVQFISKLFPLRPQNVQPHVISG